jgi:hypothetical protein
VLRRSILISAEQPTSHFFAENLSLAHEAGSVFDINPRSVRAYRAEGVNASLIELGHTTLWDRFGGTRRGLKQDERDIDILFFGRLTHRRACALSTYANLFDRFRCHLALSDNARPNIESGPNFVVGEDKRDLLARAKVVLNIHGEDEPYFEWLRVAEAICAGCAVVSEHATDIAPLESGRHILSGRLDSLGLLCALLIDDDARRERICTDAYQLLVEQRPLANAASQLIDAARDVSATPISVDAVLAARQERARQPIRMTSEARAIQPSDRHDLSNGETQALRALKTQLLAITSLRRRLESVEHRLDGATGESRTMVVTDSPAWETDPTPALTVIIPMYNHGTEILDALDSLKRSVRRDWEVVVVDDASTDDGGATVRAWMDTHPYRACRLVRHELNRGLAAARNTGVAQARTDRLLMLDADNELRRNAMSRLMEALDSDPDASFAYGIIEQFSADGPRGLLSCYGWEPERLRAGNYIDALAMIRRGAIEAMHGYSYDPRLYGWEDYDLWVRMAESGRHGSFVPEIIARYRVGHGSMISHTNISTSDAYAALAEHAPNLMENLLIPR